MGSLEFLWVPLTSLNLFWVPLAQNCSFISIFILVKKTIIINQFRVLVKSVPSYERFHPQLVWGFFHISAYILTLASMNSFKTLHQYLLFKNKMVINLNSNAKIISVKGKIKTISLVNYCHYLSLSATNLMPAWNSTVCLSPYQKEI